MKFGYFQFDVVRGDKKANLSKVRSALQHASVDVLVLPEFFAIGYLFDSKDMLFGLAESAAGGETTAALMEIAAENNCCIVGNIAEREGRELYNTSVTVSPEGYLGKYRKVHLSEYEKRYFTRGDRLKIVAYRGVKLGLQICYDIRFPEISRELVLKGADVLCVSANYGGPGTPIVARARAIENMSYVVLCNRVGHERGAGLEASFLGKSAVFGPEGEILAGDIENAEHFGAAEADPESARSKGSAICRDFYAEIKILPNTEID
jgi:predicted amidohydrolase